MTACKAALRTISWPGAKYRVLDTLLSWCPEAPFDVLCEPFFGTGALSLALSPLVTGPVLAAESNAHLRNWWRWLFAEPEAVVDAISELRDNFRDAGADRAVFDALRDGYNRRAQESPNSIETAAHLWVLIFASTNNLARFNQHGQYNQTWGTGRVVPDVRMVISEETLRRVSDVGQRIRLFADFKEALDEFLDYADEGNTGFAYLDPPYILEAGMYDANRWSLSDLTMLMAYIEGMEERGLWWIYTDYMAKGEQEHPYSVALSRFRQVPIMSTRDARPSGMALSKHEVLIIGSVAEERMTDPGGFAQCQMPL